MAKELRLTDTDIEKLRKKLAFNWSSDAGLSIAHSIGDAATEKAIRWLENNNETDVAARLEKQMRLDTRV